MRSAMEVAMDNLIKLIFLAMIVFQFVDYGINLNRVAKSSGNKQMDDAPFMHIVVLCFAMMLFLSVRG